MIKSFFSIGSTGEFKVAQLVARAVNSVPPTKNVIVIGSVRETVSFIINPFGALT